jgi:hypothetical protein
MLKSALFVCICLLGLLSLSAKEWSYGQTVGDSTGNTVIHSIAPYGDSLLLMAGSFSSRSLLLGDFELLNNGQEDAFVAVLNKQGQYLWARQIGGAGEDVAYAAVADKSGNIYVGGAFKSLTLPIGSFNLINQGDRDGFILCFRPDYSVAYALRTGGLYTDDIVALQVGKDGHLFAAGQSLNNLSTPSERVYIMKFNTNGGLVWQRNGINTVASLKASSLAIDANDNCYLSGGFSGRLAFDGGTTLNSASGSVGFLVKYNANGGFEKALADNSVEQFNDLCWAGSFLATCGEKKSFGIGWGWPLSDSKIHVSAFNPQLSKLWERTTGGIIPLVSLDLASTIDADSEGNLYVSGRFQGRVISFAGDSMMNVLNKDYFYEQGFLLQYSSAGEELSGIAFGADLNDRGTAVAAISPTELWLAGQFESDSLKLGPYRFDNTGALREVYVHLKPPRYARNAISFLAQIKSLPVSTRPELSLLASKLYPNPAGHQITIQVEQEVKALRLEILSAEGKSVYNRQLLPEGQTIRLEVDFLPPGWYVLTLHSEGKSAHHSWIKL